MEAEALLDTCLERIAAREPEVRAFAWLDVEGARRRARELPQSAADGPLRGLPVGIKDIIDVAGMPTAMGSALFADNIAAANADIVNRLEAAGAIVVGKTVTTEMAFFSPGPTRNPWNTAHTPGGSSSGSAAAVAASMCAGAVGTQTNGSVIRPAAFCGVAGFKPSLGALSTRGVLSWSPTLDHLGFLAPSVRDCGLLFAACRQAADSRLAVGGPRHQPPRLALVRSPVWHLAEEPQRRALADAAELLRRAGAEVVEAELPPLFEHAHAAHESIMSFEGARNLGPLQRQHRDGLSRILNEFLDRGAQVGEAEYAEALDRREAMQRKLGSFLADFDAIVTAPARGEAPASLDTTGDPTFCTIWTLCGVPAATFRIATGPAGLPLGMQIVGRSGADGHLLAVATWCELVVGGNPTEARRAP